MEYFRYRLIRISSSDKENKGDSNSNFSIDLSKYGHDCLQDAIGCSVIEAVFQNVFYNIRQNINDVFSFEENGQLRQDITLPEGFYTLNDIMTKLQTDINNVLVAGSVAVTLGQYNKKIIITFSGTTAKIYADLTATAANTIGFLNDTSVLAVITADSIVKLDGLQQAYVECDQLADNQLIDVKNATTRSVIKVINVDAPFGGSVKYENPHSADRIVWSKPRDLNKVWRIRLTNASDEDLEMQNFHLKLILAIFY